jgi:hypothetical protein
LAFPTAGMSRASRSYNAHIRGVALSITVLDVIDNFFARDSDPDVSRIPGKRLYDLGGEARRLAQVTAPPQVRPGSIYLGGWPSANFWAVSGDLIMSTLLYADSVVVKDPLTDWFSYSQYRVPHLMASRPGYLDPETQTPRTAQTRAFLSTIIPALRALRPLVDSGAVVFASSADLNLRESAAIDSMTRELMARLVTDAATYSRQFAATEIAAEDNIRGQFVCAPGDQDASVRRSLEHGMRHFAREYTLARSVGATYTAPFRHEAHLCQHGIGAFTRPGERVVTALMTTDLPILANLTPDVVAKVRRDDSYEDFRAQLHAVYADFPVGVSEDEASEYLRDQERALLSGPLKEAERHLDRGVLRRLGAALTKGSFKIATGLAADAILGTPLLATSVATAKTAAEVAAENRPQGPQRVWNALVQHSRKVEQELTGVQERHGERVQSGAQGDVPYWGIPDTPSMSVAITAGLTLCDYMPPRHVAALERGHQEEAYGPCPCGSGLTFRYCCRNLRADF